MARKKYNPFTGNFDYVDPVLGSLTGAYLNEALGIWSEVKDYVIDDVVSWDSRLYKCIADVQGGSQGNLSNAPDIDTTHWEQTVAKLFSAYPEDNQDVPAEGLIVKYSHERYNTGEFSLDSDGVVTVLESGLYIIGVSHTNHDITSSRTTSYTTVRIDGSDIDNFVIAGYLRNEANGEVTAYAAIPVPLTAGQTVSVFTRDKDNAHLAIGTTAAGCNLTIWSPVGARGPKGEQGEPGLGVPAGGSTNAVLSKKSDNDNDTEWSDMTYKKLKDTPDNYEADGLVASSTEADKMIFTKYPYQLARLNRETDLFLADASLEIIEDPASGMAPLDVPTDETKWNFTINVDSGNKIILEADAVASEVIFGRESIHYYWDSIIKITNTTATAIDFQTRILKASDDSEISSMSVSVPANATHYKITSPPLVGYENLLEGTRVYITIQASATGLQLEAATSRIYAATATVHSDLIHWADVWIDGKLYYPNDMVRDDLWLALAKTKTTERPAPAHTYNIKYVVTDNDNSTSWDPTWETVTEDINEVVTGNMFVLEKLGWMHGAKAWLIKDDTLEHTVIMKLLRSDGTYEELDRETVPSNRIPATGWVEFRFNAPILLGELSHVECTVVTKSISTQITKLHGVWEYAGVRSIIFERDPRVGEWNIDNADSELRIHKQQADGLGAIDLTNIAAGDYIQFTGNDAEWIYYVTGAVVFNDPICTIPVSIHVKSGSLEVNENTDMRVYNYGAGSSVQYVRADRTNVPDNVVGIKRPADDPPTDYYYGTDFYFEEAVISADWDLIASLGGVVYNSNSDEREYLMLAVTEESASVYTGEALVTFRTPFSGHVTGIRANVSVEPQGSDIIIDIKKYIPDLDEWHSIFEQQLHIDDGQRTSVTSSSPYILATDARFEDDEEFRVDVIQVGLTSPGQGLKITFLSRI